MMTVILLMVPLTIPKLFGVRIYGVLTGSMTPAYSVGGVVYVKETEASEIQAGDVITYRMGTDTEYVMTHRVVAVENASFVTKGDANNTLDSEPVAFDRLLGKVIWFIPGVADIAEFLNSEEGQSVVILFFALALILWSAADIIEEKAKPPKAKPVWKVSWVQCTGFLLILGALIYMGSVCLDYEKSVSEYAALEAEVFVEKEKTGEGLSDTDSYVLAKIAKMQEQNPDVIGWIQFDGLDLSYPIMHGEDDTYYLKHTFSGEKNSSGSIFMEAANRSDFNDSHTIIYGHNMKNESMFGLLKNYKTEDFYAGNEYFTIYTPYQVYRYEIFAYYDISMYDEIYDISFIPGEEFQQVIERMCSRSYYDTQIRPESMDKIMTLSTCSEKGKRFVVHARRIIQQL